VVNQADNVNPETVSTYSLCITEDHDVGKSIKDSLVCLLSPQRSYHTTVVDQVTTKRSDQQLQSTRILQKSLEAFVATSNFMPTFDMGFNTSGSIPDYSMILQIIHRNWLGRFLDNHKTISFTNIYSFVV
jgi:hypothetical protein